MYYSSQFYSILVGFVPSDGSLSQPNWGMGVTLSVVELPNSSEFIRPQTIGGSALSILEISKIGG